MTNYSKLYELYSKLETLTFIQRDISGAGKITDLFTLDISPRVNSKTLSGCKVKYRSQLLAIVSGEIEETKNLISTLSAEE